MARAPIQFEGLRELRRDMRAMGLRAEGRELTKALKSGAEEVATAAVPLVRQRSGALAASYRAGARGANAYVSSRLPYAGVQEFGGVIRPKGTPITILPQTAVVRARDAKEESIVERIGDAMEDLARRHGWH